MELRERLHRAAGSADLGQMLYDSSEEVLRVLLDNPNLTEDHLKILLSRKSLTPLFLRQLASRQGLLKPYQVKLALVRHPHTPRSVSLELVRHVYVFDLAQVAATPGVAPEIRRVAEEAVVGRLPALSLGERLTLARRGSPRMLSALLCDADASVFRVALENPRLTEEGVVKALAADRMKAEAVEAIASHPRWGLRYDVQVAVVRHPRASLRRMLAWIGLIRRDHLFDITADRRMPEERRRYVSEMLRRRRRRPLPHARSGVPEHGRQGI